MEILLYIGKFIGVLFCLTASGATGALIAGTILFGSQKIESHCGLLPHSGGQIG